jgi:sodium-dependent dicarboxylate transporter 2/3/5
LCALIILFTEVASNTAVVALSLPLLGGVGASLGIPTMSLLMTITLAGSLSFMLPMATPPNAIVFSGGGLRVWDMMKAGFGLNIIFCGLIVLASLYWLPWVIS